MPPELDDLFPADRALIHLAPGAVLLGGFATSAAADLLAGIAAVATEAPFRHFGASGGRRMSVAMTNAGQLGWTSDHGRYRYTTDDPSTARPWPSMPSAFLEIARAAADMAGYREFAPEACLINRYEPGSRLSLHQDRDEAELGQPIVSVSLGVGATFLWGGDRRGDRARRIALRHGDVLVWGGPARLTFHGVHSIASEWHPLTGTLRYNLTFRRVT